MKQRQFDRCIERTQSAKFVNKPLPDLDLTKAFQMLSDDLCLTDKRYMHCYLKELPLPIPTVAKVAVLT